MQYSSDAENKTVILKITMRKLEVVYSMFPRIKFDGMSYKLNDFFNNGTSFREVVPSQNCRRDVEQNMNDVSIYFNCSHVHKEN